MIDQDLWFDPEYKARKEELIGIYRSINEHACNHPLLVADSLLDNFLWELVEEFNIESLSIPLDELMPILKEDCLANLRRRMEEFETDAGRKGDVSS